ncbi:MAG: CRISPR-associated endonuclease Cas1 [Desulfovibrio sp.]|nr:CRISPR-associated endonuclease Cas1 [Desulfovibrio sp.]
MDNTVSVLRQWLSDLHWLECRIVLQNTFAEQAREHPLLVLDALLKYASHQGHPWSSSWFFRPETDFDARMHQGKRYGIRLIFPGCEDASVGEEAVSCIKKWLDGPHRHFTLADSDVPCVLSGRQILSDMDKTIGAHGMVSGVSIEFLSPVPFKTKEGWKGKATAGWLGESLLRRVERLFGAMPEELRSNTSKAWKPLTLIPWFWNYEVFQHRSRSTGGTRYLNGFRGQLFLEGDLDEALPLLAFGTHCNVGSRLSAGQGAFRVCREKAFLDASLFSDDLWTHAWTSLAEHKPNLPHDLPEGIVEKLYDYFEDPQADSLIPASCIMLLGSGLYGLLSKSLTRLDPELCTRWKENLPWMPSGDEIPNAVNKLLPAQDVLVRTLASRFPLISSSVSTAGKAYLSQHAEETDSWTPEPDEDVCIEDDHEETGKPPLRRPCYLLRPGAATVLFDGKVLSRYQGSIVGSAPLGHVSMLILQGAGSISLPLVRACNHRAIPIIFCSASGHYQNMIPPEGFVWRERSDRQLRHWDSLGEKGRLATGFVIIEAKIRNFTAWLGDTHSGDNLNETAKDAIAKLRKVSVRGEALGIEGSFARRCFTIINTMVAKRGFESEKRLPHQRTDAWNCLLDSVSSLVYNRLCVLLIGEGLSPYRGYMHCQHSRYATLAADLQEIFRARTEHWLVDMIRDGRADTTWVQRLEDTQRLSLTREAWYCLIEEFEKELERSSQGCKSTWLELMEGQVHRFRLFCTEGAKLELFIENEWQEVSFPDAKSSVPTA